MTDRNNSSGFAVVSSRVAYAGEMLTNETVSVRTPDGDIVERQVVRHPGAVAVVAIHQGQLVFVKQYRAAIDDELLEIPAGKIDVPGEPPAETARRELIEEVGLDPQHVELLGEFYPAAGFSDEVLTIFAATDCVEVERQVDGVEEAHSQIVRFPVEQVDELLAPGKLLDAKSVIGLTWARERGMFG